MFVCQSTWTVRRGAPRAPQVSVDSLEMFLMMKSVCRAVSHSLPRPGRLSRAAEAAAEAEDDALEEPRASEQTDKGPERLEVLAPGRRSQQRKPAKPRTLQSEASSYCRSCRLCTSSFYLCVVSGSWGGWVRRRWGASCPPASSLLTGSGRRSSRGCSGAAERSSGGPEPR